MTERIPTPCPLCRSGRSLLTAAQCVARHGEALPCLDCRRELSATATAYLRAFDANLAGCDR